MPFADGITGTAPRRPSKAANAGVEALRLRSPPTKRRLPPPSPATPSPKMMCGLHEDFELPEEEITLKGRELCCFAVVYLIAVLFLCIFFETVMPVINNPTYPFYNVVPDYTHYKDVAAYKQT